MATQRGVHGWQLWYCLVLLEIQILWALSIHSKSESTFKEGPKVILMLITVGEAVPATLVTDIPIRGSALLEGMVSPLGQSPNRPLQAKLGKFRAI